MSDEKPRPAELQARQELENAERLGDDESARAARKRLDALGARIEVAAAERAATVRKSTPPQDRRAPGRQTS